MTTNARQGTALITGASGGIGAIYADRLAKRGYDLILVARNEERLSVVAKRLTRETGRSVQTIAVDLNDKAGVARVATRQHHDAGEQRRLRSGGSPAQLRRG
jgi:short-subunit dehydrogenase